MSASYLFWIHLSQHADNEMKSRKRWFWLACEHSRIYIGGNVKIIQVYERYDGTNKIQILNNTELFLKLFHIQSKEIGNNKCYEETTELEKWQSEISPEHWR